MKGTWKKKEWLNYDIKSFFDKLTVRWGRTRNDIKERANRLLIDD